MLHSTPGLPLHLGLVFVTLTLVMLTHKVVSSHHSA